MRWAISGGAGFLGLHLARRLLADGHEVRTLDLAPLDDAELERGRRGAARRRPLGRATAAALVEGADVLVHAAAALPIQASRESIRSVNVGGTATLLAAAAEAGVRRHVLVSSTAVYGIPKVHPIHEDDAARRRRLVRRVEDRGRGGDARLRPARARVRDRPPEDVHRARAARRLRDPLRLDPRRPADLHARRAAQNRYQLLAVEDLVDAIVLAARAAGGGRGDGERGGEGVRHRAGRPPGADRPRRVVVTPDVRSRRARRRSRCARSELLRVSPLAEWHYKTAHRDSFVDVEKAERLLGWEPRFSNAEALCRTYDWYLAHRDTLAAAGVTHRVPWNQQALALLKRIS